MTDRSTNSIYMTHGITDGYIVMLDYLKDKYPGLTQDGIPSLDSGVIGWPGISVGPEQLVEIRRWLRNLRANPDPMERGARKRYILDYSSPSARAFADLTLYVLQHTNLEHTFETTKHSTELVFKTLRDARFYDGTMSMALGTEL